jgi:hypothetical protein
MITDTEAPKAAYPVRGLRQGRFDDGSGAYVMLVGTGDYGKNDGLDPEQYVRTRGRPWRRW